jgi:hypothetical protein
MPTLDTDQRHINAFYFKELYWREFQNILDGKIFFIEGVKPI